MRLIFILLVTLCCCGCGHNITTYFDGQEFSVAGILVYRNGKVLQSNIKENASVSLDTNTGNTTNDTNETSTSSSVKLDMTTGEQITGYKVELEKEKGKTNE